MPVNGDLPRIADLLRQRNAIDAEIAAITGRPMASGHLGEWIAAQIFWIQLADSASRKGIDGWFGTGPLAGKAVNVKWFLKREGLLDITDAADLDYYLVLAGPASTATSSRGRTRPWCIVSVHLFDARELLQQQHARGVRIGVASSVRNAQWRAAEIYASGNNPILRLQSEQESSLALFRPQ